MRIIFILITLCGLLPAPLVAQRITSAAEAVAEIVGYRQSYPHLVILEYLDFLAIPNVSSEKENIRKNAEFIVKMMEKRQINAQILETGGNPVVYGELKTSGAQQTLLFYAHYDGQPVDSSLWTGSAPFDPVIRPGKLYPGATSPEPILLSPPSSNIDEEWRIYARSASDDKAPIMAMMIAIDALQYTGISLNNNIKFIFEGEEEAGSTNLRTFCETHAKLLKSDVLFICDGPVYFSGAPTLFFGVRGITSLDITVYGPNVNLHSGHYGNWAPNPAMRLAQLLATMKNEDGEVLIDGFYDTVVPLSDLERQALRKIPPYDDKLRDLYGFSGAEGSGKSLMELIQYPSLNVRGLQSGWVGAQARTIIPATATASLDIRLVKGNEPEEMVQKVVEHIHDLGFHVVRRDPDDMTRRIYPLIASVKSGGGYKAARTSMDLPVSQRAIEALREIAEPVLMPTLGGSVPIYIFAEVLQVPIIGLPIVNYDNNQHQPNENLRIGHFWKGIDTMGAMMMMDDGRGK